MYAKGRSAYLLGACLPLTADTNLRSLIHQPSGYVSVWRSCCPLPPPCFLLYWAEAACYPQKALIACNQQLKVQSMAAQGLHVGWRATTPHKSQQPAATRTRSSQAHSQYKATTACQAQSQHPTSSSSSTSSVVMRPIEVSRHIAAARAAESSRSDALFVDPYAAALSGQHQQQQQQQLLLDVIATRYIDECLLNAMAATNVNSIQSGDYRQVVLLGDGMDCRPFRLLWPPGTLLFMVAPAEVHEQAEAQLAAAAAAAAAAEDGGSPVVPPAHVPRGCLLRRVNMNWAAAAAAAVAGGGSAAAEEDAAAASDSGNGTGTVSSSSSGSTVFMQELQKAGFRADRLSVWAIQGLHNQGVSQDQLRQLLTEVTNLAAFHSLLVGELPGPLSKREVDNVLAEAGLLGAVVTYDRDDISYGRWQEAEQSGVLKSHGNLGLGSSSGGAAAAAVGDDVIQDRWLVTGQQLRLSLEQMGLYEEWSSEYAENDMGDDDIGNFS